MSIEPQGYQTDRPWSAVVRQVAVTLWCGFLGAGLLLLCLLMAWHYLWPLAQDPNWQTLGALFLVGWLCSSVAVAMGLSLASAPKPRHLAHLDADDDEDADLENSLVIDRPKDDVSSDR